jgi:hypothetical protein
LRLVLGRLGNFAARNFAVRGRVNPRYLTNFGYRVTFMLLHPLLFGSSTRWVQQDLYKQDLSGIRRPHDNAGFW